MTDHPIPDACFDEDAIVLAKKGAGKTVLSKGIVERSLDNGERTLVIDPKGDWWGLKASADGKGDGYPVAIFGGRHADMPFSMETAQALAKTLADTNLPAILDVSDMPPKPRAEALAVFLKALFKHNRNSLFLVLDEVHMLAPQSPSGAEAYALREIIMHMVTMGRQRGFRILSICQRTQLVDKTLITQADTQITMRLTHKLDKAPAITWLDGNAPDDFADQAKGNMGKLAVGEAFVGSVGAEFFERVKVPMNRTFDSSATPKRGEELVQPQTLAQVDLSALKEALKPKEEPEPDAPAARKVIGVPKGEVELRVQKAKAQGHAEGKRQGYEIGRADGWKEAIEAAQIELSKIKLRELIAFPGSGLQEGELAPKPQWQPGTRVQGHGTGQAGVNDRSSVSSGGISRAESVPTKAGVTQPKVVTAGETAPSFTGPEQRVMDALAFWDALGFQSPSREQVAFVAKYSVKSGGFRNTLGALRSRGLIDYDGGDIVAKSLPELMAFPSFNDLASRLSGPQLRVLEPLKDGAEWTRPDLAEQAGYSPTSGGFRNTLGSLRTQKILDYGKGGTVQVLPWVSTLLDTAA